MKRLIVLFVCFMLLLINIPVYAQVNTSSATKYYYDGQWHDYNIPPTYLQVNGEMLQTDMPPIIFDDRSVVPARAVFEKLGAKVSWDEAKSQVAVSMNNTNILLTINDKIAIVNDKKYEMEIPSKIINSRTMIPTRFVAEMLGMKVDWKAAQRLITIDYTPSDVVFNPDSPPEKNEKAADVKINKIEYTTKDNKSRIIVSSDSAIDQYSTFELEDHPRLVIDVKNAVLDVEKKEFEINYNNISKIRSAQYEINPNVTRVVVDLKMWTSYKIELSRDKKQLYIDFNNAIANVTNVKFTQSGSINTVDISMDYLQKPSMSRYSNPDRIVLDIPLAKLDAAEKVIKANGNIVKSVRYAQYDPNTVRIVVDVEGQPQFEVKETTNGLKLEITTPSYKNVYYSNMDKPQLIIYGSNTISDYTEKSDPYSNKHTISVPYSWLDLGTGRIHINDAYFDYIDITKNTQTATTDIVFYAKKPYKYLVNAQTTGGKTIIDVVEDKSNVPDSSNIPANLELNPGAKNKVVVIDPGHGGKDPGAVYKDEIKEKDANLDISLRLYKMLKNAGVKVYITRKDDAFVELAERAELANRLDATLFISIHNNAIQDPDYDGTMTLYYPSSSDYYSAYGITGRRLAQIVQEEMVKHLGTTDRGLRERPKLVVLNKTKMPAVIAEVAFLTNESDRQKLKTDSFLQKAADALYVATIRALNESVSK